MMTTVPLEAEAAGLVLARVRYQLGIKLKGITDELGNFEARTDETSAWADILQAHADVLRQAEDGALLCNADMLGILNDCVADVAEDVAYLGAEAHNDDRNISQGRLATLTIIRDIVQERIAPEVDLTKPFRREIIVGILSHRIGHIADRLGFESRVGEDGPQHPSDVVAQGVESQRAYLGELRRVGDLHRPLLAAALEGASSIALPAEIDLKRRLKEIDLELREALHEEVPTDQLERLVAATRATEEWLAELAPTDDDVPAATSAPSEPDSRWDVAEADRGEFDLTKPWRREIMVGIFSDLITLLADDLSWESAAEKAIEPPRITSLVGANDERALFCITTVGQMNVLAELIAECGEKDRIGWPYDAEDAAERVAPVFIDKLVEAAKSLREYVDCAPVDELEDVTQAIIAIADWIAEIAGRAGPRC